jgi:hypothetical protein
MPLKLKLTPGNAAGRGNRCRSGTARATAERTPAGCYTAPATGKAQQELAASMRRWNVDPEPRAS